jgi:hypothetical protein
MPSIKDQEEKIRKTSIPVEAAFEDALENHSSDFFHLFSGEMLF